MLKTNHNRKSPTIELIWLRQQPGSATQAQPVRAATGATASLPSPIRIPALTYQNQENNRSHGITARHRARWQQWELDAGGSWVKSRNETLNQITPPFPATNFNLGIGYLAPSCARIFLQQRARPGRFADAGQGENTRQRLPITGRRPGAPSGTFCSRRLGAVDWLCLTCSIGDGNTSRNITNIGGVNSTCCSA